jgi:acyl transferase domain-containing protein
MNIPWDSLPFVVLEKYMHWKAEGKRIAGVSSFGLSGTNVHIVWRKPLTQKPDGRQGEENHLFTMSAKNEGPYISLRKRT